LAPGNYLATKNLQLFYKLCPQFWEKKFVRINVFGRKLRFVKSVPGSTAAGRRRSGSTTTGLEAGLPDGTYIFKPKIPNLGKFLKLKMLEYFMAIWNLLQPFDIFYGKFGNLVVMWYIFLLFG
jgi:hypothetical protein